MPDGRIDIELAGPDGDTWRWQIGDGATDGTLSSVHGSALDFCLVVTQRRNIADTDLVVTGDLARDWMSVAQAFAGAAGPGRPRASSPG